MWEDVRASLPSQTDKLHTYATISSTAEESQDNQQYNTIMILCAARDNNDDTIYRPTDTGFLRLILILIFDLIMMYLLLVFYLNT